MQPRRPVYLAGMGHCSARGLTPAAAAQAMLAGQTDHAQMQLGQPGQTEQLHYSYYRMPLPQQGWQARADAALHACVADMRQRVPDAIWRQVPVFFASSSFQVGLHEGSSGGWRGDLHGGVNNGLVVGDSTAQPLSPVLPLPLGAGSFAGQCAQSLGLQAVPLCFSHACTSSMCALDAAASWLAHGVAAHALVIATEYENTLTANGFHSLGLLSPDGCKPFAANSNGFVLGESVAALWLTTEPAFLAQAATTAQAVSTATTAAMPARWRLSACASATDTHALTAIDPSGQPLAAVIQAALQQAGLRAADVGLVKLHAAGVGATDMAEARALQQVFGTQPPPLLSLKPYLGHTLGASTLTEITVLLACLDQGHIPATLGCGQPDPALGLRPVCTRQALAPEHVLLISIGFGGSMAAAIISRGAA